MAKPQPPTPARKPPRPQPDALGALPPHHRQLFIDIMGLDLAALENALARRDAADTAQTLHRIRGALLSLQIPLPDAQADTLEYALKTTGLSASAYAQVHNVIGSLRSLLQRT